MKGRIPDGRSLTLSADSFAQSTKSTLIKAVPENRERGGKEGKRGEEEQKRRVEQGRVGEANWMQAKWFNLQRSGATLW